MVKALWNGVVIAESDKTEQVESNHYFPRQSVKMDLMTPTSYVTTCPWKGKASYFSISVDGQTNENAAWTYEAPKDAAKQITGHIAFWKGVQVVEA